MLNLEPAAAAVGGGGSGGGEDFTLPHRFLVIPPGIYLAGSPAKFLSISTWIPPGFHPIPSLYTVFFTFPWTPPGLHLDSSSLNNIFCRYWFTRGLYPPPVIPAGIRRNKIWQAVLPNCHSRDNKFRRN